MMLPKKPPVQADHRGSMRMGTHPLLTDSAMAKPLEFIRNLLKWYAPKINRTIRSNHWVFDNLGELENLLADGITEANAERCIKLIENIYTISYRAGLPTKNVQSASRFLEGAIAELEKMAGDANGKNLNAAKVLVAVKLLQAMRIKTVQVQEELDGLKARGAFENILGDARTQPAELLELGPILGEEYWQTVAMANGFDIKKDKKLRKKLLSFESQIGKCIADVIACESGKIMQLINIAGGIWNRIKRRDPSKEKDVRLILTGAINFLLAPEELAKLVKGIADEFCKKNGLEKLAIESITVLPPLEKIAKTARAETYAKELMCDIEFWFTYMLGCLHYRFAENEEAEKRLRQAIEMCKDVSNVTPEYIRKQIQKKLDAIAI